MRDVSPAEWAALATDTALAFVALWIAGERACALYTEPGGAPLLAAIALDDGRYPALSPHRPAAAWFERPEPPPAPWPDMAAPAPGHGPASGQGPRPESPGPESPGASQEGAHQLGLGPVGDGIAEPVHIRLTLRGERILALRARLGWSHKGTLGLMAGKSPRAAARFAARMAGDATVAHSLAFARAAEAALALAPPPRAAHLRALMLETERIAVHAGDLAALAGLAGLGLLESRLALRREHMLAAAAAAFGHRLMMDLVVPGGVAADIRTEGAAGLQDAIAAFEAELPGLGAGFAALGARLGGLGRIGAALAARIAPGGVAGRASGRTADLRRADPLYAGLAVPVETAGDGAARARLRRAELAESLRLARALLAALPEGPIALAPPAGSGIGAGGAESARGAAWHVLEIESGQIVRAFAADPATLHWPLLERAAVGGDAADFPLIAASIGASCSGVDL